MTRVPFAPPRAIIGILAARPVRFLVAGAINTLFGYGLFVICLAIGTSPGLSLVVANGLGILFNFACSGRLAFGSTAIQRLPAFVLTYATLCAGNYVALKILMAAGLPAAIAQAALVLPFAAIAYVVQRDLVFRGPTATGLGS